MKKFFLIAAAAAMVLPQTASADIVAGWDFFNQGEASATNSDTTTTAQFQATGIAAEVTRHNMTRFASGRGSSTDGTFGAIAGPPTASTVGTGVGVSLAAVNGNSGSIAFGITNNTGADLLFTSFDFDAILFRGNGAAGFELFLGDIATGTSIGSGTVPARSNSNADLTGGSDLHEEISVDLSAIDAFVDGQTLNFELSFTGGVPNSGGNDLNLDNIAFSASAVPEPSSMAVLGLAGLAIFTRRRK
jgi:hypothetical protein